VLCEAFLFTVLAARMPPALAVGMTGGEDGEFELEGGYRRRTGASGRWIA